MICSLGIVLFSCAKKATIFGVYENGKGEELTIDCDYRISFSKPLGGPEQFMPDSGDKITLTTDRMDAKELMVTFMAGDTLQSSFGLWNRETGEMKLINGSTYDQKSAMSCNNE